LTAICGLLASPDVDDPLVPEIAQTYLQDYQEYCKNAMKYTSLYASRHERPKASDLVFEDFTANDNISNLPKVAANSYQDSRMYSPRR